MGAADADNNPAGELLFATTVGTDGRAAAVANQVTNVTTAISANTVTATLGQDDIIDENSRFDFSFLATSKRGRKRRKKQLKKTKKTKRLQKSRRKRKKKEPKKKK